MLKTETRTQKQGLLQCHETTIREQKRGLGVGLHCQEMSKLIQPPPLPAISLLISQEPVHGVGLLLVLYY